MGHCLLHHCVSGEDPLAGEQNDHDMDSIAGVLKLYFRGLDNALFPKEVFHDLMSCVCECPLYFLHPQYTCAPQTSLTRLDNGGAFVLNELMSCACCFFQPWRTSRTELSTSTKSCCQYPATPCLSWDTCSLSSTSEFHKSELFLHVSPKVCLFFWLSVISTQDKGYDNHLLPLMSFQPRMTFLQPGKQIFLQPRCSFPYNENECWIYMERVKSTFFLLSSC